MLVSIAVSFPESKPTHCSAGLAEHCALAWLASSLTISGSQTPDDWGSASPAGSSTLLLETTGSDAIFLGPERFSTIRGNVAAMVGILRMQWGGV